MNKMKKLLCLLLSAMVLFIFAACGDDDTAGKSSKKDKAVKDDNEAVEEVVTNYMDALCDLDLKEASSYLNDEVELPFETEDDFVDVVIEEALKSNDMFAGLEEEFKPLVTLMRDSIKDSLDYEITDSEVDGDKATVKI